MSVATNENVNVYVQERDLVVNCLELHGLLV